MDQDIKQEPNVDAVLLTITLKSGLVASMLYVGEESQHRTNLQIVAAADAASGSNTSVFGILISTFTVAYREAKGTFFVPIDTISFEGASLGGLFKILEDCGYGKHIRAAKATIDAKDERGKLAPDASGVPNGLFIQAGDMTKKN